MRVHSDANAEESAGGWHDITVIPAQRIDLLSLTNGALQTLGQTRLPAGRYTQMRLVLSDDGNSVVPTGGSEVALDTAQRPAKRLEDEPGCRGRRRRGG